MPAQAKNQIRMHIEKDGTISFSTDSFEEEIHDTAAQFIEETIEILGGERKVISNDEGNAHTHTHIVGGHHIKHSH